MISFLVGHYTGYSCMCMQSMNLIWLSIWSGGVLTDNIIREVEIYRNQQKKKYSYLLKNKGQSDLIFCRYVYEP